MFLISKTDYNCNVLHINIFGMFILFNELYHPSEKIVFKNNKC